MIFIGYVLEGSDQKRIVLTLRELNIINSFMNPDPDSEKKSDPNPDPDQRTRIRNTESWSDLKTSTSKQKDQTKGYRTS